jgi:hypothetical protein
VTLPSTNDSQPPPGRKTLRTQTRAASVLAEPLTIGEWKKNRGGDSIRISLRSFEGFELIDIRTWHGSEEGQRKPGKGFAASVRHLPQLFKTIGAALTKARELRLLDEGQP